MSRRLAYLFLSAGMMSALSACGDRMGDLRQYTNEIRARKGGHIEALPQIKPFEVYTYADQDARSPFIQGGDVNNTGLVNKSAAVAGLHPDFNRNREYLEQFPLDGLRMVGTLYIDGSLYGLVKDSDNVVHRVAVGNYMGQNYGKIISITDSEIKLHEMIPDGQGGWSERVTAVTLSQ
ncbi:MAG TPA: pilus assembly protein PilP [Gammaproteobacteria bacterium]|nr:pilus assembly protein PilP [Gammaproteobacteria bacterium]